MGTLAANVLHFTRVLRSSGIPIGTDKVMDAVRALPRAGFERRADWHATLAALFLTRHEQQALFDEAFDRFWRDPALEEKMRAALLPRVGALAPPAAPGGRLDRALRRRPSDGPSRETTEISVDAALTFSREERLRHLDFEKMTPEEWAAARQLVSRMRLPIADIATRRHRSSHSGPIDLRATLRGMVRRGGDIATVARRKRAIRAPPIAVLCDISGSMHRYSRMFLHFLHALARDRGRISSFVFATRLTNVTRALRDRDVDEALAKVGSDAKDWAGGTRIGECLGEFNRRWARRVLGQNASVMLLTDGLDRDDAVRLATEMERLRRSCVSLVWLNPLLRFERFEPLAAGVAAMLPKVDAMIPMHNIASLTDLAACLSSRRRPGPNDWAPSFDGVTP